MIFNKKLKCRLLSTYTCISMSGGCDVTDWHVIVEYGAKLINQLLSPEGWYILCAVVDSTGDCVSLTCQVNPLKCCITVEMVPLLDMVLAVLLLLTILDDKIWIPPEITLSVRKHQSFISVRLTGCVECLNSLFVVQNLQDKPNDGFA